MKKITYLKKLAGLAALILVMFACAPEMDDKVDIGLPPTEDQLDFSATPSASKPNIIEIKNTSKIAGIVNWDFGNNSKGKGESATVEYPFKGSYTVVMTLFSKGGSTSKSKTITIANDDMSMLNTPMYTALTGGASNLAGKTWVFDQYHDGHFGVGPAGDAAPIWWSCPAEGKTKSCLYSQEFTFTQVGVKMVWTNNGNVYSNESGRKALAALGYPNSVVPGDGDFDIAYTPKAAYTFTLKESANTLTLNDGAFFGHYAGTSTYEILKLTNDEMYLKCVSTVEPGNGWWYRLIPKEKNVKPVIIIPLKATPLSEDFEGTTNKVDFTYEDMGPLVNAHYFNPAPVPINTSAKVFLYQKTAAFYSNIYFAAKDYKFDLTEQNKIKMKVFIPSYNDYLGKYDVAGSWISVNQLQHQVAVKLQDSSLGGNAWTTQTEVVKANLESDKWIDLTFDFSSVSTRQDYNKIVIQFGAEGHAAPGIFFFDDFSFGK
jgi:PKD repeat protein